MQTFSLDPPGNNRHNFTGFPNHLATAAEPDALFASGDTAYTYTTSLTTGATHDAVHLRRPAPPGPAADRGDPGGRADSRSWPRPTQMTYPTPVRVPALLPANYGHPTQVTLTESAATSASGLTASPPRTTTTATSYDDHGRVVSATDEVGTTTTTEYDDRYGLVTSQTTTGADGSQAQMVNTLTADGGNIATSTTSVGTAGGTLSARQTLSYEYDDDGQLTTPDAGLGAGRRARRRRARRRPRRDRHHVRTLGRPRRRDPVDHHHDRRRHRRRPGHDGHHRPGVGQGGQPTPTRMGRTTTLDYDAVGRRTKITTPGGLVTTTAYTPTQTTVTSPDGRVTRTTVDLLGRTVSITDNVRNGALVADPAARTLSSPRLQPRRHVDDGHRPGRPHDDHGAGRVRAHGQQGRARPGSPTSPPTTTVPPTPWSPPSLPEGVDAAPDEHDHQLRRRRPGDPVPDDVSRPDSGGTVADPVSAKAFDGLGQPTSSTGNDLTVTTDRSGPGGIAASSTATPQSTTTSPASRSPRSRRAP